MKLNYKIILIFILLLILFMIIAYNYKINQSLFISGASENSSSNVIVWNNKKSYSLNEIINIIESIEKNISKFKPLESSELNKLKQYAKKNKMPIGQLISLRHIIATQNSINANININQYYEPIKKYYISNINKLNNSKEIYQFLNNYPVPPLKIISILKDNNLKISSELQNIAEKNDSENTTTYKQILIDSNLFENKLVKWIHETYPNIKFKTQEELVKEQTTKFGKPFSTPDILFNEPILIKVKTNENEEITQLIRWIDAKNYTLVKIPFIMQSIHKQADKYLKNYGPGALAFHYGKVNDIHIPNILMLDASFI